jgi:hypothetical protein
MADITKPASAEPAIIAANLRKIDKPGSALRGTCSLYLKGCHQHIHDVLWGEGNGREWVRLPDREWTGQDGKSHRSKIITWENDTVARRFEAAAIDAIHALIAATEAKNQPAETPT